MGEYIHSLLTEESNMRILVLGGTLYLGRHFVEAAHAAGHQVTLFHRGRTGPDLFPDLEVIHGDRRRDLERLVGGTWDAVLDTCGYLPADVRASAGLLRHRAGQYTFISTISVYEDIATPGLDESAPLKPWQGPLPSEMTPEAYGPLKAACEEEVRTAFGEEALILRPGLIVGPWDPSGRFTYWVGRMARGGEVLAPGKPNRQVQFIDVRDLAGWVLHLMERQVSGTLHATGPATPHTMEFVLETCRRVAGSNAALVWVDEDWLVRQGVAPYSEIPLWYPGGQDGVDIRKALAQGLEVRALERTVRDTLEWIPDAEPHSLSRAGLDPDREGELLRTWAEERAE